MLSHPVLFEPLVPSEVYFFLAQVDFLERNVSRLIEVAVCFPQLPN